MDTVEQQTDLFALLEAMVNNSNLTHVSSLLISLAMVLQIYGIVVLWQNTGGSGTVGTLVRLGLSVIVVAIVFLLAGKGLDHATVHVSVHGVGMGVGEYQAPALQAMALTIQTVKGGLYAMASTAGQFSYIFLGLGMAARFPSMNFHKIAPLIVAVLAVFGLASVVGAEHAHEMLGPAVKVTQALIFVNLLYLVMVGWGLYRGVPGYAREA